MNAGNGVVLFVIIFAAAISRLESNQTISRLIIQKLNRVKTMAQFMEEFDIETSGYSYKDMIEEEDGETSPMDDILTCQPNQKFEPIPKETTDPFMFYPPCIQVNRCDGCCNTDLMECVALKKSLHSIDVYKIPSDGKKPYLHRVEYWNHDSCSCQCKTKQEHCSSNQSYDPNNCECVCNTKPKICPNKKQWSNIKCDCVCSDSNPCTGGRTRNSNTCQCV